MRAGVAEYALTVHQDFELVVSVLHLRLDAMLRNQFALQAAGQASEAWSNQAAVNLDSGVLVHNGK